jgi:hypothetical protein
MLFKIPTLVPNVKNNPLGDGTRHVFALHLPFPLPSPPLLAVRPMMMNTDTSLLRIPEDLRPVRQVLMRK